VSDKNFLKYKNARFRLENTLQSASLNWTAQVSQMHVCAVLTRSVQGF